LGWNIVEALLARGETTVAVMDIAQRQNETKVQFFIGDMVDQSFVEDVLRKAKVTCIIHTASPPHGVDQSVYRRVNVDGTRSVVEAAIAVGVPKLVFTSSASVVFDGGDLIGVDERLPYTEKPIDNYVATKIDAEKIVLAANGRGKLRTVAIRPATIFGPGDRQALPPIIKIIREGRTRWQLGDGTNLFDFTYVGNVVKAHVLAADKLSEPEPHVNLSVRLPSVGMTVPNRPIPTSATVSHPPSPAGASGNVAPTITPVVRSKFDQFSPAAIDSEEGAQLHVAGQAFFITNGEPLPFWTFMRATWRAWGEGYDPDAKPFVLPRGIAHYVATAAEYAAWLVGKEATFTRFRVQFACAHRWHSIEKARLVLGYEPDVGLEEGINRAVEWLRAKEKETPGYIH